MPDKNTEGLKYYQGALDTNDYLYRISVKGLIFNKSGEVLVVKETGRTNWDLPGGGMDHGEDIKAALARELKEEVSLSGDFTYKIIVVEDPSIVSRINALQLRLIFTVVPAVMRFGIGKDADEIAFINPHNFKHSDDSAERKIYDYSLLSVQPT